MPNRIPYSHQTILQSDINAVTDAVTQNYITGGDYVRQFEENVAEYVGAKYALSFNSGTAALHAALFAVGVKEQDEVIVPAITYVATANAACYLGATPIFVDINLEDNYNLSFYQVEKKLTAKTKAIIPVDYSGLPVDIKRLRQLCPSHIAIVEDAAHAFGASRYGRPVGVDADITTFSFHPVKTITTGEGGMVVTDNPTYFHLMKIFRQNGVTYNQVFASDEPWRYNQVALGYNYKLSDINAALGVSQLSHIEYFLHERSKCADYYDKVLPSLIVRPPKDTSFENISSNHLYPILVNYRKMMYNHLKKHGIDCQVHYYPVPLQQYYRRKYGYQEGMFPNAEWFYEHELSIPLFPMLRYDQIDYIVQQIKKVEQKNT